MTTPAETTKTRRTGIQMGSVAPTFLVADVGGTGRWYAEYLGFHIAGTFPDSEPYAYASLQRDGVEIMLLRLAGYDKPDLTTLRPEGLWDAYGAARENITHASVGRAARRWGSTAPGARVRI